MKPEEVDSCVKLGNRYIPAVNIQVEGFPGFIEINETSEWYGIYFEVLFETGALWTISQGSNYVDGKEFDSSIEITEHPKWGMVETKDMPGVTITVPNWETFLGLYDEMKRSRHGQAC